MWLKFKGKIKLYKHLLQYKREKFVYSLLTFLVKKIDLWDIRRKFILQKIRDFFHRVARFIRRSKVWSKWLLYKKEKDIHINIRLYLKKMFYHGVFSIIFIRYPELPHPKQTTSIFLDFFYWFFNMRRLWECYFVHSTKFNKIAFRITFASAIFCTFFLHGQLAWLADLVGGVTSLVYICSFLSFVSKLWLGRLGFVFCYVMIFHGGFGLTKMQAFNNVKKYGHTQASICILLGVIYFIILYRLPGAQDILQIFGFDPFTFQSHIVTPLSRILQDIKDGLADYFKKEEKVKKKKPLDFSDESTWNKEWKHHMDLHITQLDEEETVKWDEFWENKDPADRDVDYQWHLEWNLSMTRNEVIEKAIRKKMAEEAKARMDKFTSELLNNKHDEAKVQRVMRKYVRWSKMLDISRKDIYAKIFKKLEEDAIKQAAEHSAANPSRKKRLWEAVFGKKE